jgi:ATP-dependent protease ClpP protease subunit
MAEILLHDYVDEWGYQYCIGSGDLSAGVVVPQINAAKGQELIINIATVGGSFLDALLIYHACIEHGDVTTINQGYALSAGGLIAMAGKRRITYSTSLFMMHKAMVDMWLMGNMNADEIKKQAGGLEACDKIQVELLTKYTGVDEVEAEQMLSAETYLTGREAVDKGFFTELIELGETLPMATATYKHMVAKTRGKFAAVAKENLKIEDMSTHTELLAEIKSQREENKGFFAWVTKTLGIKAQEEQPKEEEQETEEAESEETDLAKENEELKAKLAAVEAENTEKDAVLVEATAALKEFKAQSAAFKTELSSIRSNYVPKEPKKEFNTLENAEAEAKFVKPTKK